MRRRAAESDLVIVNHHLFFADLALRTTGGPPGKAPGGEALVITSYSIHYTKLYDGGRVRKF